MPKDPSLDAEVAKEAYKRGILTRQEKAYIEAHSETETAQAIATVLGRSLPIVQKYIQNNLKLIPVGSDLAPEEELRLTLQMAFKHTPEWLALKHEFLPDEVTLFEHRYAKHLAQFKDDLTSTEETQIFSLIKFEILSSRVLARIQDAEKDTKRMRLALQKAYDKYPSLLDMSQEDRLFVENIQRHIDNIVSMKHAASKEYIDLQSEHSSIMKALKGTRDQRISKIESNKVTFVDVIKEIMDDNVRAREARQMELMRVASAKEMQRLSKPHAYADKRVDLPILNAETIQQ